MVNIIPKSVGSVLKKLAIGTALTIGTFLTSVLIKNPIEKATLVDMRIDKKSDFRGDNDFTIQTQPFIKDNAKELNDLKKEFELEVEFNDGTKERVPLLSLELHPEDGEHVLFYNYTYDEYKIKENDTPIQM